MELIDTHCHIHFPDYELDPQEVLRDSVKAGVGKLLCVGCTLTDSELAIDFARRHENIWASIGLHPHEGSVYVNDHQSLQRFHQLAKSPKVIAIGETGLDYHYDHSTRADQKKLLRFQLDVAMEHNLPLIFHVREAFADFWKILDSYPDARGVVHSFTAGQTEVDEILARKLLIGLNGIVTFTKDQAQLKAIKDIPLTSIILETDAPFLTPVPFRGTICQPKHVVETARFLAKLRGDSIEKLATQTSKNAIKLFNLQ